MVSIYENNNSNRVIYKIYDFKYHKILTEKFNNYSLIFKNFRLFFLVLKKFPLILKRLFTSNKNGHPSQTLYFFFIFIIIASTILLMITATVVVILDFLNYAEVDEAIKNIKENTFIKNIDIPLISRSSIKVLSGVIVSITSLLLLIVPNANVLIISLATEFVCVNDYLEYGVQRQLLQGNLEHLVEYISENEKEPKIHFHTYSFGTILAIDYIYPFGNLTSKNANAFCEALITIGTPYEFINSYYPQFYKNRKTELGEKLDWLNIYSIADALATNFRDDLKIGDSQFGIGKTLNRPSNINYEVTYLKKGGALSFLLLNSLKVHNMYWDNNILGQSCLRLIFSEMSKRNLINEKN